MKYSPVLMTSAYNERKGRALLSFSIVPKSTSDAYCAYYDVIHSGMWLSTF